MCWTPPLHNTASTVVRRATGCAPPNPMGTWLPEPSPALARVGAAAVAVGSTMHVIGGFDAAPSARVDVFQDDANGIEWAASPAAPPMLTPRHNLSAAAQGAFVYAIGGEAGGAPLGAVEQYNTQSQTWAQRRKLPTARASLAVVTIADDTILALGGRVAGGVSAAVEAYDAYADVWTPRPPLGVAREGLCAGEVGGVVYAVGGFNGTYLNTLEGWNGSGWSLLSPMKYPRSGAACAVTGGGLVVYGGLNAQGVVDLVEVSVDPLPTHHWPSGLFP